MKNFSLLALAFAVVGLVGCASDDDTVIDGDTDTTMVAPIEPMEPPAPMPADTTMMEGDTTMMEGDTATAPAM
jgi:hypothetical protein